MSQIGQYKACLFDMDGLLISTEDLYTQVVNEILEEHGKGPMPWEVKIKLQGLPGPEAAKTFLEWADLPYTQEEYFKKTFSRQIELWPTCEFLPGAKELLVHLHSNEIPFALATSSAKPSYEIKTAHLRDTFDLFGEHVVTGDDKRIPPGKGKPAPNIWWVALESLNADRRSKGLDEIKPEECLVFEDGVPGVNAGKAAGCRVIWVPHKGALKVLNGDEHGIIGDGGEILDSLVDLDKKKYGIH